MNLEMMERLDRAVHRKYGSKWSKLLDPGIPRFLSRMAPRMTGRCREVGVDLFFGERMNVVIPDPVSEMIYTYGFFDELVTYMAVLGVERDEVVVDVGAHFGYLSLLFSHLVGENGRVVSFEPTPSTFEILRRNAEARSNITVMQAALGEEAGEIELHDYGVALSAWNTVSGKPRLVGNDVPMEFETRRVALRTLDEVLTELDVRPALLKIDAENYELQVLKGALTTLRELHPKVIMETGSEESEPATRLLVDLGYVAFVPVRVGELARVDDPIASCRVNKDLLFVAADEAAAFESGVTVR